MPSLPSPVSLLLSLTVLYFFVQVVYFITAIFADLSQIKSFISLLSATSRAAILSHIVSRLFPLSRLGYSSS